MNETKFLNAPKYSSYIEILYLKSPIAFLILHFLDPLMINLISHLNLLINTFNFS